MKLWNRSVSSRRTHSFASIRGNVFTRFLIFGLSYSTTIDKQVLILMSFVGTDALCDVILNVRG